MKKNESFLNYLYIQEKKINKDSIFVFLLNLQTFDIYLEVAGFEAGIQHMINMC